MREQARPSVHESTQSGGDFLGSKFGVESVFAPVYDACIRTKHGVPDVEHDVFFFKRCLLKIAVICVLDVRSTQDRFNKPAISVYDPDEKLMR